MHDNPCQRWCRDSDCAYRAVSQRFRGLMQDLFAGTQPYLTLRSRLLRNLNGTLQEVLMNFFLNRVIPENSRVVL